MTMRHNHVLGRWPVVDAEGYVLGDDRTLHRGSGWYCWTLGRHWAGATLLGQTPPNEMTRSMPSWQTMHATATASFSLFCDASCVLGPPPGLAAPVAEQLSGPSREAVLDEAQRYMEGAAAVLSPHLQRIAFVLPKAWWNTWWSGFYAVHAKAFRLTLFTDVAEAWAHLGAPPEVIAEVAALHGALSHDEGLPRSVEGLLFEDPTRTIGDIAKRLGLSARSLQRTLGEGGETFALMRTRVRLDLADRHLASGELVKVVASRIGFASTSHFVAWYRAQRGTTPGRA